MLGINPFNTGYATSEATKERLIKQGVSWGSVASYKKFTPEEQEVYFRVRDGILNKGVVDRIIAPEDIDEVSNFYIDLDNDVVRYSIPLRYRGQIQPGREQRVEIDLRTIEDPALRHTLNEFYVVASAFWGKEHRISDLSRDVKGNPKGIKTLERGNSKGLNALPNTLAGSHQVAAKMLTQLPNVHGRKKAIGRHLFSDFVQKKFGEKVATKALDKFRQLSCARAKAILKAQYDELGRLNADDPQVPILQKKIQFSSQIEASTKSDRVKVQNVALDKTLFSEEEFKALTSLIQEANEANQQAVDRAVNVVQNLLKQKGDALNAKELPDAEKAKLHRQIEDLAKVFTALLGSSLSVLTKWDVEQRRLLNEGEVALVDELALLIPLQHEVDYLTGLHRRLEGVDQYALSVALTAAPSTSCLEEQRAAAKLVEKQVREDIEKGYQAATKTWNPYAKFKNWKNTGAKHEEQRLQYVYAKDVVGLLYRGRSEYSKYVREQFSTAVAKKEGIEDILLREAISFTDLRIEGLDYSADRIKKSGLLLDQRGKESRDPELMRELESDLDEVVRWADVAIDFDQLDTRDLRGEDPERLTTLLKTHREGSHPQQSINWNCPSPGKPLSEQMELVVPKPLRQTAKRVNRCAKITGGVAAAAGAIGKGLEMAGVVPKGTTVQAVTAVAKKGFYGIPALWSMKNVYDMFNRSSVTALGGAAIVTSAYMGDANTYQTILVNLPVFVAGFVGMTKVIANKFPKIISPHEGPPEISSAIAKKNDARKKKENMAIMTALALYGAAWYYFSQQEQEPCQDTSIDYMTNVAAELAGSAAAWAWENPLIMLGIGVLKNQGSERLEPYTDKMKAPLRLPARAVGLGVDTLAETASLAQLGNGVQGLWKSVPTIASMSEGAKGFWAKAPALGTVQDTLRPFLAPLTDRICPIEGATCSYQLRRMFGMFGMSKMFDIPFMI